MSRFKMAVENAYLFQASPDQRKTYIRNETRIDLWRDGDRTRKLTGTLRYRIGKIFKQGLSKFKEFGMPGAYCGDPASATAEEGEMILERLSDFVIEDADGLILEKVTQSQRGLYGRQKRKESQ